MKTLSKHRDKILKGMALMGVTAVTSVFAIGISWGSMVTRVSTLETNQSAIAKDMGEIKTTTLLACTGVQDLRERLGLSREDCNGRE